MRLLPDWPPKDWRAYIALWASIIGFALLLWVAWWLLEKLLGQADRLIAELVRDRNVRQEVGAVLITIINALAWGLKLLLAGMIAVLLTLGMAINRRSIRLGKEGLEASGGDGDAPPLPVRITNPPGDAVPTTDVGPTLDKDGELPESERLP